LIISDLHIITADSLNQRQKVAVFSLWNSQYPETLAFAHVSELEAYLVILKEQKHYLLAEGEKFYGWAFTFIREDEKWFAIILEEAYQRRGIGKAMLRRLQEDEPCLNGWVIDREGHRRMDGNIYRSPLDFYLKNQFTLQSACRLETDKISAVKISWQR
jgi:GNAT superfamily N-acetyltransferase